MGAVDTDGAVRDGRHVRYRGASVRRCAVQPSQAARAALRRPCHACPRPSLLASRRTRHRCVQRGQGGAPVRRGRAAPGSTSCHFQSSLQAMMGRWGGVSAPPSIHRRTLVWRGVSFSSGRAHTSCPVDLSRSLPRRWAPGMDVGESPVLPITMARRRELCSAYLVRPSGPGQSRVSIRSFIFCICFFETGQKFTSYIDKVGANRKYKA